MQNKRDMTDFCTSSSVMELWSNENKTMYRFIGFLSSQRNIDKLWKNKYQII